jgi:hypothetical protein
MRSPVLMRSGRRGQPIKGQDERQAALDGLAYASAFSPASGLRQARFRHFNKGKLS